MRVNTFFHKEYVMEQSTEICFFYALRNFVHTSMLRVTSVIRICTLYIFQC